MNAFCAEFFGTAMIIVFGGGVVSNVVWKLVTIVLYPDN